MKTFQYINENFELNSSVLAGEDSRFHTVYIITFENGCFYVGKHSCSRLEEDSYFASGKLPNILKRDGVRYDRHILSYEETSSEALALEAKILQDNYVYDSDKCLNCYQGSPPDLTGHVVVSKGDSFKMVNPKLLTFYKSDGWLEKGLSFKYINNGDITTKVLTSKLQPYLDSGWVRGSLSTKGRTFIRKNDNLKFVNIEDVDDFIKEGWVKSGNLDGRKVIRKGCTIKKVNPEDLCEYLADGWVRSSCVEGLLTITKDGKFKRVSADDIPKFIAEGWVRGGNVKGKLYITNGASERRINPSELNTYLEDGWVKGKIKQLYLNNGVVQRKIRITDTLLLEQLLSEGFKYGSLTNRGLILSPKGNLRSVKLDEIEGLRAKGFKFIRELRP